MTLGEFFEASTQNPSIIVFYFVAVPLSAALALVFGRGAGTQSPWKYLYTALVYLSCVPGIFAITLSAYLLIFENKSALDINLYTQLLPVVSMALTLWLITRNVSLDDIPGFGKLSGLLLIITAVLIIMWILERTRLIAFTFVPLPYVVLILVGIFVAIRLGMSKMTK